MQQVWLIMSTISKENYLKAIFIEEVERNSHVPVNILSAKLGISQAAVSDMAKKLANEDLLDYQKYKGLKTTQKGKSIALDIIRKHRLWEVFLTNKLGYNWDEVHEEAELLEHSTSTKLINKIEEFLNFPIFDPHGYPIPDKNGNFPNTREIINFSQVEVGKFYEVARVSDDNKEVINYLTKIGIVLGEKLFIENSLEFDKTLIVKIKGNSIAISSQISEKFSVYLVEGA